jgi:hypothetical protein
MTKQPDVVYVMDFTKVLTIIRDKYTPEERLEFVSTFLKWFCIICGQEREMCKCEVPSHANAK